LLARRWYRRLARRYAGDTLAGRHTEAHRAELGPGGQKGKEHRLAHAHKDCGGLYGFDAKTGKTLKTRSIIVKREMENS